MTDYEILVLLVAYEANRLSFFERRLLKKFYEAARGIGTEVTDEQMSEIFTDKQIAFIRKCGKKRRLNKRIRL